MEFFSPYILYIYRAISTGTTLIEITNNKRKYTTMHISFTPKINPPNNKEYEAALLSYQKEHFGEIDSTVPQSVDEPSEVTMEEPPAENSILNEPLNGITIWAGGYFDNVAAVKEEAEAAAAALQAVANEECIAHIFRNR